MIAEGQQDLAIEYILGMLDADSVKGFEAELRSNPELAAFVDDLRESTATLAQAAPLHQPPPHLRARVLAVVQGEAVVAGPKRTRQFVWLPWALAASLAVAGFVLLADRSGLQADVRRWQALSEHWRVEAETSNRESASGRLAAQSIDARAAALQTQNTALEQEVAALNSRNAIAQERVVALQKGSEAFEQEIAEMKSRDALAQVTIATLSSKVAALAKAAVVVVWDTQNQRGIVKLSNLPKAAAGKDYQLWVIDPKYPSPVSAGVVAAGEGGFARLAFKPNQPIETPDKFAISVEKSGGAPTPAGPIVFIGN